MLETKLQYCLYVHHSLTIVTRYQICTKVKAMIQRCRHYRSHLSNFATETPTLICQRAVSCCFWLCSPVGVACDNYNSIKTGSMSSSRATSIYSLSSHKGSFPRNPWLIFSFYVAFRISLCLIQSFQWKLLCFQLTQILTRQAQAPWLLFLISPSPPGKTRQTVTRFLNGIF